MALKQEKGGSLRTLLEEMVRTLRFIWAALCPGQGGAAEPHGVGELRCVEPGEVRRGMGLFLDRRGELRLLLPRCRPIAAPFILFRLKREGFSRCRVEACERGLQVQARR